MAGRQRRVAGRAGSVLAELLARWRAWGSTSTGAARPDGGSTRARVSTCCRPTGGSPASITCPGAARPGRGPDGRRRGVLAGAAADRLAPLRSGRGDRHLQHLRLRRAQDAAEDVLVVDLFHVVQLAVKMAGDVRRRVARAKYGRRGRSGDPQYSVKRLLGGNVEDVPGAQFAKIIETLARAGAAPVAGRSDRTGRLTAIAPAAG